MADSQFNSAHFFENDTYEELQEEVFKPRTKKVVKEFDRFLVDNLKELEFKKIQQKKDQFRYIFDDRSKQIKVVHNKEGIYVIAMKASKGKSKEAEEDTDIEQAVVEKKNGDKFEHLMDRVMDALEVVECEMFDMETKTRLASTSLEPIDANGVKVKSDKKDKSDKNGDDKEKNGDGNNDGNVDTTDTTDTHSVSETDDEEQLVVDGDKEDGEEYDPEAESEPQEPEETPTGKSEGKKRRSTRLRKTKKRKLTIVSADDDESDGSLEMSSSRRGKKKSQRGRKKRKLNPTKKERKDTRERNRKITGKWIKGQYVAAIHLAEDYGMDDKEINELIEYLYTNDL